MATARICIVAPEFIGPFPNGGVGTACYWEALTLAQAGHDVTVLYTGPTERETPEHWEAHFAATAPFRYVDAARAIPAADIARIARYDVPCAEARMAELVLAWLRDQPFDLVMFQEFLGHGARALQAQRSGHALDGTRTATTMHSSRQWIYEGMKRLPGGSRDLAVDFLEKESVRLADRVIAPSHHMAEWGASRWRLTTQTDVIPYCYDAALGTPPAIVEHAGPFRHLIFFGRLETRKGLHLFCQALVEHAALRDHVDQVTFLGKPSSVEGLPSVEYISAQMAKAPGLRWEIKGDLGSFEAQAWLQSQQNALVVTPSLVDNLPYAVIELHTRRIPFVSTNIGGIPEIVGDANRHALADPDAASLASVLARVCGDGRLAIDYRSGYDVTAANRAHVDCVRNMLAEPAARPNLISTRAFEVVVTNAADSDVLARVRARACAADPDLNDARWRRFDEWRSTASLTRALFLDAGVVPEPGCAAALFAALDRQGTAAATLYFVREDRARQAPVAVPLGASLELGWRINVFGGPCFVANPSTFEAITSSAIRGRFAFWAAYAALATAGGALAMIPASFYTAAADATPSDGHAELEAVLDQFHSRVPEALDLRWILKSAFSGADSSALGASGPAAPKNGVGREIYDRLIGMPDAMLTAYAGLASNVDSDPFLREFDAIRERLSAATARWRENGARVFVSGAGLHTRLLFAICPELGRHVAGFIDRLPMPEWLGRPCVTPDGFRDEMADAIVYSSREWEHEMYARLKDARVEHLLLYRDSPPAPDVSTSVRLRNRFAHQGANLDALAAIYLPPSWATGYVSGSDAAFLAEMIAAVQPRTVVELGVASGASSAAILQSLDQLPNAGERVLISCDVRETCYFNEAYQTGQACGEMYPAPRARWRREFTMDARALRATLPPASVDLAFIDANHSHPWPLLDLLHATEVVKPGSWLILHDVDLPIQYPEYQVFGPRWLYEAWPFNKVKGVGRWTSIAAVQMPADPSSLVPMAMALIDKPWEQAPIPSHVVLPAAFAGVQSELEARLAPVLVSR